MDPSIHFRDLNWKAANHSDGSSTPKNGRMFLYPRLPMHVSPQNLIPIFPRSFVHATSCSRKLKRELAVCEGCSRRRCPPANRPSLEGSRGGGDLDDWPRS